MKRGQYVTAKLADGNGSCQGVYWRDNGDGTIQVKGQLGEYRCLPDVTVVPDSNLFGGTLDFVLFLREHMSELS